MLESLEVTIDSTQERGMRTFVFSSNYFAYKPRDSYYKIYKSLILHHAYYSSPKEIYFNSKGKRTFITNHEHVKKPISISHLTWVQA